MGKFHALGATVRQKVTPIEGVVVERKFDESTDNMQYRVVSTDADGSQHERWFNNDNIEFVADPAPAPAEAAPESVAGGAANAQDTVTGSV